MISPRFKKFAFKNWLPMMGFVISTFAAMWFGFHFISDAIYFNDPRHQDQALQNWMTPRYIVKSYDLPKALVVEVLEIDEASVKRPLKLETLAADKNVTLEQLTEIIRKAAAKYRAGKK